MDMLEMRARSGAGIDAVEALRVGRPEAGPGQALVRLTAATLNYRDLIGVKGQLPGLTKEPDYVPLSCGCGVVEAVGPGATRVKPGDRVTPLFAQGWLTGGAEEMSLTHLGGSIDGVAREYAVFDTESLCLVPDTISDLEAATLPCAGLTAWSSLFGVRPVKPGDTVLLQGTGGVSIAALQFAKAAGARVIITSSSDAKLRRAQALGADATLNYLTQPDWAAFAREVTGGRGVDLIVDVVGATQLDKAVRSLTNGGVIAAVGLLDGEFSWGKDVGVMIAPVTVGNRIQMEEMLRGVEASGIRPVVDAVYPLDEFKTAMKHLESGRFFGKVAISIGH